MAARAQQGPQNLAGSYDQYQYPNPSQGYQPSPFMRKFATNAPPPQPFPPQGQEQRSFPPQGQDQGYGGPPSTQQYQPAPAAPQYQTEPGFEPGFGPVDPYREATRQVPPPEHCSWQPDLVNNVRIIGVVGQPPEVRQLHTGAVVANLRLGVKNPGYLSKQTMTWLNVELWEEKALQVSSYIQQGMQVAIGGSMREDTFINRATGQPGSRIKIKGNSIQIVDSNRPLGIQRSARNTSARSNDAMLQLYNVWKADQTTNFIQLTKQKQSQPDRTLRMLTDAMALDQADVNQADAERMASELNIGPVKSAWVDCATVSKAMDSALAEQIASGKATDLSNLRLKPVLERLQSDAAPRSDEQGQELPTIQDTMNAMVDMLGERPGLSLSYAQIRFVKAMRLKGIDLSSISQPPSNISDELSDFQATSKGRFSQGIKSSYQEQLYGAPKPGQYPQNVGGTPTQQPPSPSQYELGAYQQQTQSESPYF